MTSFMDLYFSLREGIQTRTMTDFDDHSELFGGTVKTDRTMAIEQCVESDSDSTLHGLGPGWHFTDFNITFSFFIFCGYL